jgi:hypothetical protein
VIDALDAFIEGILSFVRAPADQEGSGHMGRCQGVRRGGLPCKKWAKGGSEFCSKHACDQSFPFRLARVPNGIRRSDTSPEERILLSAEDAAKLDWYVEFLANLKVLVSHSGNRLPLLEGEFDHDEPMLNVRGRTLPVAALAVFLPDGELEVAVGKGVFDRVSPVLTPLEVREGDGGPTVRAIFEGLVVPGERPYIVFAPFGGQLFVSSHPAVPVRDDGLPDMKALWLEASDWLVPPGDETPELRSNLDLSLARLNAAMATRYLRHRADRRPPLPTDDPAGAAMHVPLAEICKLAKVTESEALKALERTTAWGWRTLEVDQERVFGEPEVYLRFYPHSGWEHTLPRMSRLLKLSGPGDRAAARFVNNTFLNTNWKPKHLELSKMAELCGLEGHFQHDNTCRIRPAIRKALDRLREVGILKNWEFGVHQVLLEWESARQMPVPGERRRPV